VTESEDGARSVAMLEGEERDGGDARELADEPSDGAQFFFTATGNGEHHGAGTLIAKILEHVIERIAV